ncbi:MAG: hypothetical protein KA788_11510 [Lacunisphaera sp.]|nr:hypothetical protein [Lacunisphaera sp.]
MKPEDHALDRLFRAAAAAPRDADAPMPAALQARILSARREWLGRGGADDFGAFLSLARRCLAGAALVAVATVLVCHRAQDNAVPAMDSMVLESVAELSLLP